MSRRRDMARKVVTHGKIWDVNAKSRIVPERTIECTKPCPGEVTTTQLCLLGEEPGVGGHFDKRPDKKGQPRGRNYGSLC